MKHSRALFLLLYLILSDAQPLYSQGIQISASASRIEPIFPITQETLTRQDALRLLASSYGQLTHNELPLKCGLPMIAQAIQHRDRLTPQEKSALTEVLQRPTRQKSILRGEFRIHYDTTGVNTPAMLDPVTHQRIPGTHDEYADSVGTIANHVYTFQTGTLGYLPPPSDSISGGGPEYDIYISELGNIYGITWFDSLIAGTGRRYTSFIEIDNDFIFINPPNNRGLPGVRIELAHDFHHAIQIGSYGFWQNEVYYYEITSVWLEDVLYTDVNDYYQYVNETFGHFRNPHVPFTSNNIIMYSRSIWAHYAAKRFGQNAIRRSWELILEYRPLVAIDSALKEHSSSFPVAFAEWTKWNLFTREQSDTIQYYPEGNNYIAITKTAVQFTPPSQSIPGTLPFLSARYYNVNVQDTILTVALSNIDFQSALASDTTMFPYTFLLNVLQLDSTYLYTRTSVFVRLEVSQEQNWFTQFFVNGQPVTSTPAQNGLPSAFRLAQNYPNPFNPATTISFSLPFKAFVSLKVFDALGRQVAVLVSEELPAATYTRQWDAAGLPSGVYFYRLQAGTFVGTKKLILLR